MLRGRSLCCRDPDTRTCWLFPVAPFAGQEEVLSQEGGRSPRKVLWHGHGLGRYPPKAPGDLGSRAAGEGQSTAAKHSCAELAEQERMKLAASRTSP